MYRGTNVKRQQMSPQRQCMPEDSGTTSLKYGKRKLLT